MENHLNIVLIGMMGAGKNYIGEKLAKLVSHFSYVDLDAEIEKETGMTISEIFEKHSEEYFRDLETQMIKRFAGNKNQIISAGGGAFERDENIEALKENGLVFYLKATSETLFRRLEGQTNRPLLNTESPLQTIRKLLKKREKNYLKADYVIDTNQKQAYTILDDILKEYDKHVK